MKRAVILILLLALVSCKRDGFMESDAPSSIPEMSQVEVFEESISLKPDEKEASSPTGEVSQTEMEESVPEAKEPEPEKEFSRDDWKLILVNRDNLIPEDFEVTLNSTHGYLMDHRITDAYDSMYEGAKNEGIDLLLCYGYRTKEQSQALFQKQINRQIASGLDYDRAVEEAKKWVAPPGTSEHHTGLALDIVTPAYQMLTHDFMNTDAAKWMKDNAHKYGFILRYPEDKEEITGITFEPWHYRYVGEEAAKYIYENGLCLEEFLKGDNVN